MESIDFCQQIKIQRHRELSENLRNTYTENFRAIIAMGQAAIKAALLTNAGAAVACLTLMSNVIKEMNANNLACNLFNTEIVNAMTCWGIGVFCSCAAYGFTYLTQERVSIEFQAQLILLDEAFWKDKEYSMHFSMIPRIYRWVAIIMVILSYGLLLFGTLKCRSALLALLH